MKSIDKSKTSFLTSESNGGIDDEYYINEIIGIEELTYEDYVEATPAAAKDGDEKEQPKHLRTDEHQLEFDFNAD